MELHGTARGSEIGALQVPWNHGIPRSCSFHRNRHTPSFMEFHWIPWNCSCQRNWRILSSMEFHGSPWNCSCNRNWRRPSSMEFHGIFFCYLMDPLASSILWILNLDIIPWNLSFQIFIKIISTFAECINFRKFISTLYRFVSLFHQRMFCYQYLRYTTCISDITHYVKKIPFKISFQCSLKFICKNSMELSPDFHGTFWTTFEQHLWFHGIPRNLSNKTSSSMEFHGLLSKSKVAWNSMEHFPHSRIPWNSMELFRFPQKFHGIPWNSRELFWSSMEFHGIPWNLINLIFKKSSF